MPHTTLKTWIALAAMLWLGACVTDETPPPATTAASNPDPKPVAAEPETTGPAAAEPESEPEPEAPKIKADDLLGLEPRAVQEIFGPVSLKRWEGQAQVMQFANQHCVIDVYFYEKAPGDAFEAKFVDSRDHKGDKVNADTCVASLVPGGTWAGAPSDTPNFGK